jgi:hypothetical protein
MTHGFSAFIIYDYLCLLLQAPNSRRPPPKIIDLCLWMCRWVLTNGVSGGSGHYVVLPARVRESTRGRLIYHALVVPKGHPRTALMHPLNAGTFNLVSGERAVSSSAGNLDFTGPESNLMEDPPWRFGGIRNLEGTI